MQFPVRIEFQGMNPADAVQDKILRYLAELESRFGRVTAGHVVVKVPGEHLFTRPQGGQCRPHPAR